MPERERGISVARFTELLWRTFCEQLGKIGAMPGLSAMEAALIHGWIEPQDARDPDGEIHRNDAARILHEFLRRETGEADEEDWDAAKTLKDLYDCRTCVRHVAQVYCKGIMTAKDGIFGMRDPLSQADAREAVMRAVRPSERILLKGDAETVCLTAAEAFRLAAGPDVLCIDVRTPGEYENGHPEGFVNVPLMRLLEAPAEALGDRERLILLGCDGGYRAEIAAMRLIDLGYGNVRCFGWE